MIKGLKVFVVFFTTMIAFGSVGFATETPKADVTPGALCAPSDPNFKGYDYPEHIARCNRHVSKSDKTQIAASYGGIPEKDWANYEFDHLIPLCVGGSNDLSNLWPEPISQAKKKDLLENDLCLAMKAGTITQAAAVAKVHQFFISEMVTVFMPPMFAPVQTSDGLLCSTADGVQVRFSIEGSDQIDHVSISVTAADGLHEALHIDDLVSARPPHNRKGHIFDGLSRYVLSTSEDHFEVYLPQDLEQVKNGPFDGYLKVGFESNFPKLSHLSCAQGYASF